MTDEARLESRQYPSSYLPDFYEDEIDLSELVGVLWRRKIPILIPVVIVTGLAVLYCLVATKKYLIAAQVTPGITGYSEGKPARPFTNKDLKEWFDKKAYLTALQGKVAQEELKKIKIRASTPRGTNVLSLWLYWPDKKKGERILNCVIDSLAKSTGTGLAKSLLVSKMSCRITLGSSW